MSQICWNNLEVVRRRRVKVIVDLQTVLHV